MKRLWNDPTFQILSIMIGGMLLTPWIMVGFFFYIAWIAQIVGHPF